MISGIGTDQTSKTAYPNESQSNPFYFTGGLLKVKEKE